MSVKPFLLACFLATVAFGSVPKIGDRAPQFSLPSSKGAMVALKDYVDRSKVVLVFYRGYW